MIEFIGIIYYEDNVGNTDSERTRPQEISFNCSCPDWALLCKHVVAVLYGIGVRFDEDPLLFFELRGIDVGRFVDVTMENRIESMLANADAPSERIITDDHWKEIFGV